MDFHSLLAVSPIDGRYAAKTAALRQYFSEFALIRDRVRVEVEYFIALCEIPLPQLADFGEGTGATREELFASLRRLYQAMTPEDAQKVKDIEKITNHDVKAVEYFIKENFKTLGISRWQEFVHFGLTSQDINNTAQPLMLKEALENEYLPALHEVISILAADVEAWKDVPMLAKTHGQPATPTRLGKEFQVFVARLEEQLRQFSLLTWPAKFGGATGNMNAHKQVAKNEVGSSAMPHKVNPIDFENAEGNLGMADAVLTFLSMKLPISRLQRDLTDSTVQRNIGVPVAHGLIALASLKKGLGKLILNRPAIDADLHRNWAVVAEAIQTILRRENYPNPYETLKNLTRTGAAIDERTIEDFVNGLDVSESVKEELRSITPWNYTGF